MRAKAVFPTLLALLLSLAFAGLAFSLIGDVAINGVVDSADMTLISTAYQSVPGGANWDWRADVTRDGAVDISDITVAGRSYSDTFNFHWPRRVSNGEPQNTNLTNVVGTDVAVDSRGHVHVVWEENGSDCNEIHYTQLDMAGNTLVDDILLAHHGADPRVAVDASGYVYIVWHSSCSPLGSFYTKLAPNGIILTGLRYSDSTSGNFPAVGADAYGHAHLLNVDANGREDYSIVDGRGNLLLNNSQVNIRYPTYPSGGGEGAVAVDKEGTRHLLWKQNTGSEDILSYTRVLSNGVTTLNQITVVQLAQWNSKPIYVRVDSQGAAHFLWRDAPLGTIYWRRIDRNGNLSAVRVVTDEAPSAADVSVHFVIDASDRIHMVSRASAYTRIGYTRLDRDGNVLVPFRHIAFPQNRIFQGIGVDPQGNAVVIYAENDVTPHALYVLSTVPDAAANDPTRADLSLDYARADANAYFVRIIDRPTLTVTVVNAGYVTATNVVVSVTKTISPTYLPIANQVIASLPPYSSATFARTVDIPPFENQTLLGFRVQATTATPETTLTNNVITLSVVTLPPAHAFNLVVGSMDETYAPTDRSQADYLFGAHLDASARPPITFTGEITFTEPFNVFFDIPLDGAKAPQMTTTMQLTLTAPGFSTATQAVTATRSIANPYQVVITPTLPVMMYLNQWGTIRGTVYSPTVPILTPITNAQVTLDYGVAVTTTDASGVFTFTKVVSGSHMLEALHARNEPTTATVAVRTQQTATPALNMPFTTKGYLRGYVTDDQGNPFSGATVNLYGVGGPTLLASTAADASGYYSFTVANAGAYPNYKVTSQPPDTNLYDSGNFALTAGIPYRLDFALTWVVTAASMRAYGDVTSAHITEGWNTTETPTGNPIGKFLWDTFVAPPIEIIKIVSEVDEFEVDTAWGKYHYALGAKFSKVAGNPDTVNWVSVDLANYELYDYEVASGPFAAGGTSINRTSLHVARVDLVEVDASGNKTAGPYWSSTATWPNGWYARDPDGEPTPWFTSVNQKPLDWSKAAIRVFIHVGQLTNSPPYWTDWAPPASVVSLSGGGSYAGADKQCLIWRLSPNTLDVLASSQYYDWYVTGGGLAAAAVAGPPATEPAPPAPQAIGPLATARVTVTLPFTTAHVGVPFPVDLALAAPEAKPVHGIDFDLTFDRSKFQVTGVGAAPDFLGPYGAWTVISPTTLAQINASGRFTHTTVVSLGSTTGITQGRLVRITFLPITPTASTNLNLLVVRLADHNGDTSGYSLSPVDATLGIDRHQVYLPIVLRNY